jgi:post-segregation antitoxin (ccd killing protein)
MRKKFFMRVNISIPDDLHKRLVPFKDVLNISGICTVAIEREVIRMENALNGADNIDAMSLDQLRNLVKMLLIKQKAAE